MKWKKLETMKKFTWEAAKLEKQIKNLIAEIADQFSNCELPLLKLLGRHFLSRFNFFFATTWPKINSCGCWLMLPKSFRGMGLGHHKESWGLNSTKAQQPSNIPQSEPGPTKRESEGPKMALRSDSEADNRVGDYVSPCVWCPQALHEEVSDKFILRRYDESKRLSPWQRRRERAQPTGRESQFLTRYGGDLTIKIRVRSLMPP